MLWNFHELHYYNNTTYFSHSVQPSFSPHLIVHPQSGDQKKSPLFAQNGHCGGRVVLSAAPKKGWVVEEEDNSKLIGWQRGVGKDTKGPALHKAVVVCTKGVGMALNTRRTRWKNPESRCTVYTLDKKRNLFICAFQSKLLIFV